MLKKILKYTGITILILIILIIITPFLFKGKIVKMVKQETNENLNAKVDFGDFGLSLISSFPNFTFTIDSVTVDGVDSFKNVRLADIGQLKLVVNLFSVISGDNINIKKIYINHPNIDVEVLKSGKANYDIAKESTDTTEETDTSSSSFNLKLKKLVITDANIIYDDKSMDMKGVLRHLNLNLSGNFAADVSDITTNATIDTTNYTFEGVKYLSDAKVAINATVNANIAKDKYTFKKNSFKINALELGFDGWLQLLPKDVMAMDLKFDSKQTDFKNILSLVPAIYTTDFKDVQTKGKMALNGYAKGNYSDTEYPSFGINLNINDAMFKYPSLPKSVNNIQVALNINDAGTKLDQMIINLKKFHFEMAGNPFDAHMLLKTPMSDPDIAASLKGKIDLNSMKDVIPQEKGQKLNGIITTDLAVAGKMSYLDKKEYDKFKAKGSFGVKDMLYTTKSLGYDVKINNLLLNFTPQEVDLAAFNSNIGKSDLQASGKIDDFLQYALTDSAVLKGEFKMSSNYMDLNQFMEEDSAETAATTTDTAADEPLSVFPVPKNVDMTLSANIKKLLYDDYNITNIAAVMGIKDQKVSITKSNMDLMGGSMGLTGYYETTNPKQPGINFDMDIKNFDVNKTATTFNTVQKMAPIAKSAHGTFSSKLSITGKLDEHMMPVYKTLNGAGNLVPKNIEIKDFKPMVKVANALKNDKLKTWDIGNANISFEIKDGKVFVKPFDITMGKTKVNVSGSNGLDESIDYTMKFEIPRSEFGSAANSFVSGLVSQASSKGVNVKVGNVVNVNAYVTGTVTNPKVSVGLKDLGKSAIENVKEAVKQKAKEAVDSAKTLAKAALQKQANKLIADAQQQANKVRQAAQNLAAQTKKAGYAQADKLVKDAKNPLAKIGAKAAAKKMKQETDKKSQQIIDEGNKKADAIVQKAKESANKLLNSGK